jgi:hypothetical protein
MTDPAADPSAGPPRADVRRASLLLFLVLLLAGLAINPGYVDNVDSRIVLRTATRLVDAGTWGMGDVEGTYMARSEYGAIGADGSHQMKFGPLNALLDVPFLVAGRTVFGAAGLPREQAGEAGVALAAALWFALSGFLVFRISTRWLPTRAALGAALTYSFATYALVYAKSSYLETVQTTALLAAYVAALRVRERPESAREGFALGAACVAVVWIKVAAVVLLVGVVPILFGRPGARPVRGIVATLAVGAAGAAAFAALNVARFGHPLETGYATSIRFWHPLGSGVGELLFSAWGGFLPFSPAFVLAVPGWSVLRRRDPSFAAGVALSVAAAIVLYGMWCSPLGGDVWGARYLVPTAGLVAIPMGTGLAAAMRRGAWMRGSACAVVAASALLQAPPAIVSFHEIYTLRKYWAESAERPVPQRLTARLVAEKIRSDEQGYDLARLGIGDGRHVPAGVEKGFDLWPVRAAERAPARRGLAWCAWGAVVAAACAAAVALARTSRRCGATSDATQF